MVADYVDPPPMMKRGECNTCWRAGKIYYHKKCQTWLCEICFDNKDETKCKGCLKKANS